MQNTPEQEIAGFLKAIEDGSEWKKESGDLVSLLLDCPFFFLADVIPPLQAVNEFLQNASDNPSISGASCRWVQFQLEAAEYSDFVRELQRRQFQFIEPGFYI